MGDMSSFHNYQRLRMAGTLASVHEGVVVGVQQGQLNRQQNSHFSTR